MILRLCSEAFDPKLYGLRKCGERDAMVFSEIVMRDGNVAGRGDEVRLIATQRTIKALIWLGIRYKSLKR